MLLALALIATPSSAIDPPRLKSDTSVATAGFFQLSWNANSPEVRIEEITSGSPTPVYEGPDRATLLSGLADGERSYRAGAIGDNGGVTVWSEPVTVTVAHHSLQRALAFFGVGAIVFFATLLLIVRGARRYA